MIQLEHVRFGYKPSRPLFTDLSLTLGPGHIHGLLGSNGVGKTTLLKLLCGLLTSSSGRVEVAGRHPARRQPDLLRDLFFLPEEFNLPAVSFSSYVKYMAPFYPYFSGEMLRHYVRELELEEEARLDRLSMGQKKRAQIAFALACNTPLLLLDEPTNGLDIPSKAIFRRLLASYADPSRTVIISTHQVRDIDPLIDRVVILDRQGVLLDAECEQIARHVSFGPVGADDTPLYTEEGLQGLIGVTRNRSQRDSKLNLELLFNAVIRHPETIRQWLTENPKDDE